MIDMNVVMKQREETHNRQEWWLDELCSLLDRVGKTHHDQLNRGQLHEFSIRLSQRERAERHYNKGLSVFDGVETGK